MPSNFPESFDNDGNLYLVHDHLRLTLAEDYNPGDSTLTVNPDPIVFGGFPPTGIITLTDQCSDLPLRALSLSYSGLGTNTFTGLSVRPGFTDVVKSKRITDVTLNVMSDHHNQLKDALIAVETFIGVSSDISIAPLVGSMNARINFLRKLVLQPRSWFTASKTIGIVPLCIDFKDFSTREPDMWIWNFGDGDMSIISRSSLVQTGEVSKCYYTPGLYTPTLTVVNFFGTNAIAIPNMITARIEAPDESTIDFLPTNQQIYSAGVLRTEINQLISILVDTTGAQALDPITSWVWDLSDDITHTNSPQTDASYSVGGLYDVKLEAVTELGAYRWTIFENVIDVVEKFNIWHFIFDASALPTATTKTLYAYEFGLISETYKAAHLSTALSVTRDSGFLSGLPNQTQQTQEFMRNNGFSPRSLTASGDGGVASVFWSTGGPTSSSTQTIQFSEFNGFENTWTTPVLGNSTNSIARQWNWLALDSGPSVYFLFGSPGPSAFSGSPTNQDFISVDMTSYGITDINLPNYLNGADELTSNVGGQAAGNFNVYRGTWSGSSGYFVRNDGAGSFFRLKSFYMTGGIMSSPFQYILKLVDMPGATKFEGQMVSLSNGIYFFNNTGEVLLYNTVTNTWGVGGPGLTSPAFTQLQDTTVTGYDNQSNTLVAVSDQSTKAYLFFDYSSKAQMEFNQMDLTFTSLPVRPSGEQFMAGLY